MKTLPQPTHSVNDRRSHQCARYGWRPRQTSPQRLAADIAAAIKTRIAEGRAWSFAEYGIEADADMIALVLQHLPTKTADEIDALKHSWLADPCFLLEDTEGFEVHRDDLIAFRLTHTAWAVAQAHAPLKCDAWEWRVSEAVAAQIEAKRLIAHYLGWAGIPIDHNPEQVEALAKALVDAAAQQEEALA